MNPENPNALPEHIQQTINDMQKKVDEETSGMIEQHDRSGERYIDTIKTFERVSAGDSKMLSKLQVILDAEATGEQYEHEQRYIDSALYIIETFGNPYADGKSPSRDELVKLCQRAFDALIKEPYGYFEHR